ncbi:MAG: DUF1801 domain-containing protein [Acidobacteria bacterium]|nr:DUF1801 domain-containing protein [Acidobacteriota bacterium]
MASKFGTVDEYIAAQAVEVQPVLTRVREAIRKALPGAVECISYNMPTYKVNGRAVLYFAGWKKHYSLYPVDAAVLARFGKELAGYVVEKGTIRFPLGEPVPVKLIAGIAKLRGKGRHP